MNCHPSPLRFECFTEEDPSVELVLLDHGLYKELSDEFRLSYSRQILSLSILRILQK